MACHTLRIVLAAVALSAVAAAAQDSDLRLINAVVAQDQAAVKSLIAAHIDVNAAQGDGMTALHWAAWKEDLPITEALIGAGANPNAKTRLAGLTPLFMAAGNGNAAVMRALIKAGGDLHVVNPVNGQTMLMAAALTGHAEAVQLLLDGGADPNAREKAHGQTALMFAASANRAAVIRVLAAHGADNSLATEVVKIDKQPRLDDNGNPLPERPAASKAELSTGEKPRTSIPNVSLAATVTGGMTALLFAARDGQFDAVRALVETGADVNRVTGGDHTSPIVMAIVNGHYEVGKYLLDHGANPNISTEAGLAALYATIDMQYAPLSWSPNPIVAQEKVTHLELMKALIEHGADVNARLGRKLWFRPTSHDKAWVNPQGATAFWRAAQSSDVAAMKLLLANGADPNIDSDQGDSPLMVAAGVGWGPGNFSQNSTESGAWMNAVKMCLDLGVDINQQDAQGYTALHGAAFRGDNEMVRYLIGRGASMDLKSKKGYAAVDMAHGIDVVFGLPLVHPETVELMQQLGSGPPEAPVVGSAVKRALASK